MHARTSILSCVLAAFAMAQPGCTVGPNYTRPEVEQPASFRAQPTTQLTPLNQTEWWRLYHDEQLDQLVTMAIESNQNLQEAIARVDQARSLAHVSASFLLPTVTADPSYTRARSSANSASALTGKRPASSVVVNNWQIPFDLEYEVDVWGRVRRSVEASNAQTAATADDLAVVSLTVATDVATFYFALRALDDQLQILQQNVATFEEQVRLVSSQLKNGLLSPVDLYQAQSQLEATEVQLRDVQRTRANLEHALAILCGRPASSFSITANPLLDAAPPEVPAGLPGELLTRRPDIAEAEQNLISLNAQVGVATAEFYPTFTLTGSAGLESASFSHILDWRSRVASIGPSVSVPIFEGGRLKYNLAAVKAQYQQTVAAYLNQVLIAYGDVEDSLSDLHAFADEVDHSRAAVVASQDYVRTAHAQYKQGLVSYLVVIDAERTLLSNRLALSKNINSRMSASIHLIKALGGGWQLDVPK